MFCGFLLMDKGTNQTSMDVCRAVKRCLKAEHVGHLGTLDPFANGLLPILIGGATKLAEYVIEGQKTYHFSVILGKETDTLDHTGQVVREALIPSDTDAKAAQIVSKFLGEIEQIPPVYSAIKMNGLALYEHMRGSGVLPRDIETKKRKIHIYSLDFLGIEKDEAGKTLALQYRVCCSKGTYIRSLARDMAVELNTVGHCGFLRREKVDPWDVLDAIPIERGQQLQQDYIVSKIRPVEELCPNFSSIVLPSDLEKKLASGNAFETELPQLAECKSPLGFVVAGEIKFLAELSLNSSSEIFIRPRKRIY